MLAEVEGNLRPVRHLERALVIDATLERLLPLVVATRFHGRVAEYGGPVFRFIAPAPVGSGLLIRPLSPSGLASSPSRRFSARTRQERAECSRARP